MLHALLLEPFSFPFMQRALVAALLTGAVCAVLSCFLVLKGWSLMGDAISHAVLPGIVLAQVLALPLAAGAFLAGLGCALGIGYLKDNSRLREDAVMGIVFSGLFATGLVLFTKIDTGQHLLHVLFGNMLGVSADDLWQMGVVAVPTLLLAVAKRRDLMLYCFDPAHARAIGLHVRLLHYGLLALLALTVVAALKAVGIILVVAMLIAPGAIGLLVARRFDMMMLMAMLAALISCIAGTIASYHLDMATGPLIVLIQSGLFLVALGFYSFRARGIRTDATARA
ncbi:MAG: metal ABC transporter permease [Bosea sp. (in: a-proteobacteria)]